MKLFSIPAVKRKITAVLLGIGFGFLCAYFASLNMVGQDFWWTTSMWGIVFNRFLIGIVIFFAGVWTKCVLTNWPIRWWLRGPLLGAVVSVDLAIWNLYSPLPADKLMWIFWMTILMGAVYGLIIDFAATKIGGEGKKFSESLEK
jgi:hypothetical protein